MKDESTLLLPCEPQEERQEAQYTVALARHRTVDWPKLLVAAAWLAAFLIMALVLTPRPDWPVGWDAQVYWKAVVNSCTVGDPYAPGLAAQAKFHAEMHANRDPKPFSYVYGPVTVPLLRLLGRFPASLVAVLFAAAMLAGVGLTLRSGWLMAKATERAWLRYLLPFTVFFPGLLATDAVRGFNVAFALYGPILAASVRGVRRGKWMWFYVAVLVAGIVKPPLLTLLAFPVIAGRRQWIPAASVGSAGVLVFASQAWLWPKLFSEYLLAVRLQFDWYSFFGLGPAGLLAEELHDAHRPYDLPSTVFYVVFAVVMLATMLAMKSWCERKTIPWQDWIPMVWMGTMLLNPRLQDYDLAAITIPMLLAAWRMTRYVVHLGRGAKMDEQWQNWPDPALVLAGLGWFVAFNIIATQVDCETTELGVLLGLFILSVCWLRFARPDEPAVDAQRYVEADAATRFTHAAAL